MPVLRRSATTLLVLCAGAALAGCAGVATAAGRTPTASATTGAAPGRIVTIGDSIMSGYGLGDGEDWPTILAEEDGLDITNLACSGAGFTVAGSCGTDFAGLIDKAAALDPAVVVIQSSSNDLDATRDEIESATATTVATLHSRLPGTRIVGLSTIWNDESDLPDEIAWSSIALQSSLRQLGGRYVDVAQPLEGHPEWMQSDDVHPTLQGQEAILESVRSAMIAEGIRF